MTEISISENQSSLIIAPSQDLAEDWSLVLDAMDIPHSLKKEGEEWQLIIPPEFLEKAALQIELYKKETAFIESGEEVRENPTPLLALFVVFFMLYFFHIITIASGDSFNWVSVGNASSADIAKGEWWRSVTALTLHADMGHLLSNLCLLTVIAGAVCSRLGSGLGWMLILLSGILGNYLNAQMHNLEYHSIGASTAVFGAIGILGGMQLFGRFKNRHFSALIPFGGALALLAFFGMDQSTDISAHFFGFCWGTLLGILSSLIFNKIEVPKPIWQRILSILTFLFIGYCWLSALHWRLAN